MVVIITVSLQEGNSALLIASVQGHIVVARFLLSIGANLDHTNNVRAINSHYIILFS